MKTIWPHLQGKTHIIWDWNGTILDDTDLMVEVIGNVLEGHGLKRIDRQNYLDLFCFPVKNYYQTLGFDFEKESFESLSEKFTAGYREGLIRSRLHRGMKEFLHEIKISSISQNVLSAAQETYLKEQLRFFDIHHYFDHIYGIQDFHAAGKIDRGKELMRDAKIPAESTLLIGDTDHDLEVGKALGVEVLLLADGHQSFERLSSKHHRILRSRQ